MGEKRGRLSFETVARPHSVYPSCWQWDEMLNWTGDRYGAPGRVGMIIDDGHAVGRYMALLFGSPSRPDRMKRFKSLLDARRWLKSEWRAEHRAWREKCQADRIIRRRARSRPELVPAA